MKRIITILLLIYSSFILAIPSFNHEVADSLFQHLQTEIKLQDSYYLINSDNTKLKSYIQERLIALGTDLRTNPQLASKSIQVSLTSDISYKTKHSLIFSRQIQVENYHAQAIITDTTTSRIEKHINYTINKEETLKDGTITLWKPVLISLITGTLVYSLWSIE